MIHQTPFSKGSPGANTFRVILGICAALSTAAVAAQAARKPVDCTGPAAQSLIGSDVHDGDAYRLAIGAMALAPRGWQVLRCDGFQFIFHQLDREEKRYSTAMLSGVQVKPWTDEAAFIAQVKTALAAMDTATNQRLRIDSLKAITMDGRPCVDVWRSGSFDGLRTPDVTIPGPMQTSEALRACHLRDARGPGAALLVVYKTMAEQRPEGFDAAAKAFIDGIAMPNWVR
jgi:hypothetical protein